MADDFEEWPEDSAFEGAGVIVSGTVTTIPERSGLGDVPTRYPNLRIFNPGPKLMISPGHTSAVVPFKIPWSEHYRLAAELIGWPYIDPDGFKRHLPESYRLWEFAIVSSISGDVQPTPVLYCTNVEIEGVGIDPTWETQNPNRTGVIYYPDPQYEFARVTATFNTLAFDVKLLSDCPDTSSLAPEQQRNVVKREDSGGKFLSFATGQWLLKNGAAIRRDTNFRNMQFWETYSMLHYTWYDVLEDAFSNDLNQQDCGKTNDAIFDGKQPGTLILQKANREPTRSQFGVRTYQVDFDMLYVPTGVNKAQPPGPDGYDPVTFEPIYWDVVGTGTETLTPPRRPYRETDFRKLFKPR